MKTYPLPSQVITDNSFQPSIKNPVRGEGQLIRWGGSPSLYAYIILQLEENLEMNGEFMVWDIIEHPNGWDSRILDDSLERIYEALCEIITKETESHSTEPMLLPYQNINIRIIGGSEHPIASMSGAWRGAIRLALADAMSNVYE